jgi:hypothetical protein
VRLRVRRATADLERIFEDIVQKVEREKAVMALDNYESPFAEITDEDIDRLFSE